MDKRPFWGQQGRLPQHAESGLANDPRFVGTAARPARVKLVPEMERRAFLTDIPMEQRYLKTLDAYALVAFGAIFGALLVFGIFIYAIKTDNLCVKVGDAGLRCVVLEDR